MNVDMITTVLNDFSTFWNNIWEFLKPIFNIIDGATGEDKKFVKPEGSSDHLKNLNELAQSFGEIKKGEGEEADLAGYTEVDKPAGSSN